MRLALISIVLSVLAGIAAAQDRAFVQIEAHPSLVEAMSRARAYGGIVTDINGFSLGGGWYGIALGPYDPDTAVVRLARLRNEGLIPRDSYVTEGDTYGERFWPVGGASETVISDRPTGNTQTAGIAVPDSAVPDSVVPVPETPEPEETAREARRSESLLTREAKMDIQRALQWLGFYEGAIDGSYGSGTRNSMGRWQVSAGVADVTGILTTRQRSRLMEDYTAAQAELGLEPLAVDKAGISLTAPMGLVTFDRIEAPFVHYAEKDGSGVRMSLISQPGDAATLAGLYEIIQTLDIVPTLGDRSRSEEAFQITGIAPDRTTRVSARLINGNILGYILSWPEAQDKLAARALPEMERTLTSTGPALSPDTGFEPAEQSFDMVSGLEVRQPLRSASGFFVDRSGVVVTASGTVEGCGRVTIDRRHEAEVILSRDGVAVLRPIDRLVPLATASFAPAEGRLKSRVAVGGFPYGGILGDATLTFGSLEDVRGLEGEGDLLRLSLAARAGDVGGPVLDASGRVAGLLLPRPAGDDRALPADLTFALKASAVARLLEDAGIDSTPPGTGSGAVAPEDLTTLAIGMTVLVGCWK
ncbi:serine protease [Jannaschia rubra]|uniref:His-Xaa-Ser repeat protein HxsA n=1 Tax=Jannaschia rubra TaxID=282197 RepID=A0A0M6XMD3_9RHOB|nr:serine protease [Jannaschia rubra]CTQ32350.1 His-Xaa-Ser repeat protein HxsA [Jannaschia rubra]SFG46531.1 Putative peptidoglycan binding domain-containing protein [Jannaschia rubra]